MKHFGEEFTAKAQRTPGKAFKIKAARGAEAAGLPTSEGFVVFKGSKAASVVVESMPKGFSSHRDRLLAVAAVVMDRNANGLIEWKLSNGTTLREFETKEREAAPR